MKYKIIAGPTQMRVERYNFKSEPIDIGDEYITSDNEQARQFYYEHMHVACQRYIQLRWYVRCIEWSMIKEVVNEIVDRFPTMYFDGPSWIASTVPWKQAKHKEWFMVDKNTRWLLKKEYKDGIRMRQKETSGVPALQSGESPSDG
jgi:hypothetical protein